MSLTVDIEKNLDNFCLRVAFNASEGITSLLGASGCGKSMTLKCIAGVATPDRGRIVLNDRVLFDSEKRINLPPQKRKVGYLFQNYALFPNMTVYENILCSVRNAESSAARREITENVIKRLHLTSVCNQPATSVSGGEMQRTALARILVNNAEIIMLDEPFSALDEHLRFAVENEVAELMRGYGRTVLLVSHNRDEVYRLSSRVIVMHKGMKETEGEVGEVFKNPRTVNAARLTGVKNIVPASLDTGGVLHVPGWGISVTAGNHLCSGLVTMAGLRMNDIKTERTADVQGRFYDFIISGVTENLFNYIVELYRKDLPDGLPLFWQVSKDMWHSDERKEISLFIPDTAVMPLCE